MDLEKRLRELPNDLISEVIIASTIAGLGAFILYCSNWLRRWAIEKSITKSLQPDLCVGRTNKSIVFTLENDTLVPVVVRSVEIRGGDGRAFSVNLCLHELSLKQGVVSNARGWVEMPEKSNAAWHLNFKSHNPDALKRCLPLESIVAVVEYKTIFGNTRIIEIEAKSQLDWLRRAFEEYLVSPSDARMTEPATEPQKV